MSKRKLNDDVWIMFLAAAKQGLNAFILNEFTELINNADIRVGYARVYLSKTELLAAAQRKYGGQA